MGIQLRYRRFFRHTDTKIKNRYRGYGSIRYRKNLFKNIKFRCFKYISDNADEGANDDWIKNVSKGKKLFIKKMRNLAIN